MAAGHPLTAEAGARVLREGGNAVDAAVAAVLTSCVTESLLTGLGAGGYMLVHEDEETTVFDFFVAAPGSDRVERRSELVPIPIHFAPESVQVFHVGPASCGVPGTPAGLERALARFGSVPLRELAAPAAALAREGHRVTPGQAFFFSILAPIVTHHAEAAAVYAPRGRVLEAGDTFRFPELGDAIERLGEEGAEPFYRGEIAAALAEYVLERGGTLATPDLAAYEPIEREPVRARFAGSEILTNPPPSSGGILIAYALDLLERLPRGGVETFVDVMESAQAERSAEFAEDLHSEGFASRFLAADRVGAIADRLGSTTHISVIDGDGRCASVTCSNGTGSGLVVPGTGIHVNNMLGEEDLNPLGFHRHPSGRRIPSMMSPTAVVRDRELVCALGSGGSNRIRSAILQTLVALLAEGLPLEEAVIAPRVHFEAGAIQAEPGVSADGLARLEERGYEVVRWSALNVFFGGVHAVARDPASGSLSGAGDPRRGGAVAFA